MEMNKELLAKAKETKTPEELMAFAKENNMEMTEESAKAYLYVRNAAPKLSLQALALSSANAAAWRYATTANTAHTKKDCGFATKIATEKTKTYFCGLI